jgi:type IV secretion system protein VirB8
VDRQTGYVQALKPLERDLVAPDAALTRSFVAQYVIARESFDIGSLREDYRKVALWSAGEARSRYIASMQASNPQSALATLPRNALVDVQIRSISSLGKDTAFVRFVTMRADQTGTRQAPQPWAAVVSYRFSAAAMAESDRLLNPLGFQVVRYRRNAEAVPVVQSQQPNGPRNDASHAAPALSGPTTTSPTGAPTRGRTVP